MAKTTPILWPHTENADGHRPIWLRISVGQRTLYASLGVYIHERFWNARKREVRKGNPFADEYNGLIAQRLADVEAERVRLLTAREPVTAEALKAAVARPDAPADAECFLAYARGRLDALERQGNVDRHRNDRAVFRKLAAFVAGGAEAAVDLGGQRLPFEHVTTPFLRDLHAHLMGPVVGNNAATANKNLKRIGAYYRAAQAEGVAPAGVDPWAGYRSAKEDPTGRTKLSEDEVRALAGLDLDGLRRAVRDAFLFSMYAAGVRFSDMARLRVRNVVTEADGEGRGRLRLAYTMGKNKKPVDVVLAAPAARIASRYLAGPGGGARPPDAFLFPFLDGYDLSTPELYRKARGSQNALYNRYLKEIAAEAGVRKPLSSHVARHSFADYARRKGWDTYDVSKALAHHSIAQTETYLAANDRAGLNAKLDTLFGDDDE